VEKMLNRRDLRGKLKYLSRNNIQLKNTLGKGQKCNGISKKI